jgi:hypothetical protein
MEDYKNEQWWIELQQSLDGFDDSKLSDGQLKQWNTRIQGGVTVGNRNAKSGHCKKIAKLGGDANAKSGHIQKISILGGQRSKELFSKPIVSYDKITGDFVKEYYSQKEAEREFPNNCIRKVLKGKKKSSNGFIWKYKDVI